VDPEVITWTILNISDQLIGWRCTLQFKIIICIIQESTQRWNGRYCREIKKITKKGKNSA